jgi:hypothetical protein
MGVRGGHWDGGLPQDSHVDSMMGEASSALFRAWYLEHELKQIDELFLCLCGQLVWQAYQQPKAGLRLPGEKHLHRQRTQ